MSKPTISDSPALATLVILPGDTYSYDVVMTDSSGDAIDLSGYSVESHILDANRENTVSVASSITSALEGKINFSITEANTLLINNNSTWYLKLKNDSEIKTRLAGKVIIQEVE